MPDTLNDEKHSPVQVLAAVVVLRFLWPEFVQEHGCIFLAEHSGANSPPASDTATGWESFINHTHIFDVFKNNAVQIKITEELESLDVVEHDYDEFHPDFLAACELGRAAAKLWALKLSQDFPTERFRVYYTEYDNPIVRFHKVRDGEQFWISDQALKSAVDSSFRNALIYDTESLSNPVTSLLPAKN